VPTQREARVVHSERIPVGHGLPHQSRDIRVASLAQAGHPRWLHSAAITMETRPTYALRDQGGSRIKPG
jgi:hypothetical protein